MTTRRVVVTGMGVVSAIGHSVPSFWEHCLKGSTRVEPIPDAWRQYWSPRSHFWSPFALPDYKSHGFRNGDLAQYDPATLNALLATAEAIANARLDLPMLLGHNDAVTSHYSPHRAGVFMGTGIGGVSSFTENLANHTLSQCKSRLNALVLQLDDGRSELRAALLQELQGLVHGKRFNPFVVPRTMPNSIAASIGIRYHCKGPVETASVACASGTCAIGNAYRAIREGRIEMAIAGGSEYLDEPTGALFRGFDEANTLTTSTDADCCNQPFDQQRSGFLFSQGATGVLILEDYLSAVQRGAPLLAEITAYSESFDAHSLMAVRPDGVELARMLVKLLEDGGIQAEDIDYINAHGTGTPVNDEVESRVLEYVFSHRPWINSTKSLLGHSIGASGAVEAVVTVMAIAQQQLHASLNLQSPVRALNFVRDSIAAEIRLAVSQSAAFGGYNASLLFKRIE